MRRTSDELAKLSSGSQPAQPAEQSAEIARQPVKSGAEQKAKSKWFARPELGRKSRELIAQLEQTHGHIDSGSWRPQDSRWSTIETEAPAAVPSTCALLESHDSEPVHELEELFQVSPLAEEPWRSQLIAKCSKKVQEIDIVSFSVKEEVSSLSILESCFAEEPWRSELLNITELPGGEDHCPPQVSAAVVIESVLAEEPWLSEAQAAMCEIDQPQTDFSVEAASALLLVDNANSILASQWQPSIGTPLLEEPWLSDLLQTSRILNRLLPDKFSGLSDDLEVDPYADGERCMHLLELPLERLTVVQEFEMLDFSPARSAEVRVEVDCSAEISQSKQTGIAEPKKGSKTKASGKPQKKSRSRKKK